MAIQPAPVIDIEAWSQETWEAGESTFYFDKIPALKAWDILEYIRANAGRTLASTELGTGSASGMQLLQALIGVDADFVKRLRSKMFAHVYFVRPGVALTKQRLAGAEEIAFLDLDAMDIYQVLGRSLAVNFLHSFRLIAESGNPEGS